MTESGSPQKTARALDAPEIDTSRFQTKRFPVALRFDGSTTDGEHDGASGLIVLLLLEGGAETVHTAMKVDQEWTRGFGDGVPHAVDPDRERRHLGEESPHDGLHGGSTNERDALFEGGGGVVARICLARPRKNSLK